jgi:ubiquinol-cytochrome c reductase cytochrome c1 subunit
MRYNRLTDIGLTLQQIKDNLLFTTDKVGDTMVAAIDPKQAKEWFGANPPDSDRDCTFACWPRARAPVRTTSTPICAPTTRTTPRPPAGTTWFPNVGMPHVLWQLQGTAASRCSKKSRESTATKSSVQGLGAGDAGYHDAAAEYDQAVGDLVSYLQWMGEPAQNTRKRIGVGFCCSSALLTVVHLALERRLLERRQVILEPRSRAVRGLVFSEWVCTLHPTLFDF